MELISEYKLKVDLSGDVMVGVGGVTFCSLSLARALLGKFSGRFREPDFHVFATTPATNDGDECEVLTESIDRG